jgi:hypothetical protein
MVNLKKSEYSLSVTNEPKIVQMSLKTSPFKSKGIVPKITCVAS